MDGYSIGVIIKSLLEKGFNPSVLVGFLAVGFLLRQGLSLAKDYTGGRDDAMKELLAFIRANQQRQDSREDGFVSATQELAKNLAGLNSQMTEHHRNEETWQAQATARLEQLNRDIWAARGGNGRPGA